MENEVMVVSETTLQALGAVQPMLIVDQVRLIQGVMGSVMKVDEHYGKIPGTAKNVLFKSGAEKLCFTFQLTPELSRTAATILPTPAKWSARKPCRSRDAVSA